MIRANKQRIKKRALEQAQAPLQASNDYARKTASHSRPGWSEGLALIGGMLQDMDGQMGQGNFNQALTRTQQKLRLKNEAKQAELDEQRRQVILDGMKLTPSQRALMELGKEDRTFLYGAERDGVADARDLRDFNRGVVESDRNHDFRLNRAGRSDFESDRRYNRGVLESDRGYAAGRDDAAHGRAIDYANLGIAEDRLALAEQEANAPSAGGTRMATPDEVAMYGFDPETTTAQIDTNGNFKVIREQKPLLGAEAMARAATGIPNMKNAVTSLEGLLENGNPGPTTQITGLGKGGYKPGFDWGARAISGLPDFGLLEGLANFVGGKDYQQFEQAYNQFEAAALPIISGAAISESEAKRQLDAMKIRMGDNEQTRAAKLSNMRNMSDALAAAAGGDLDRLNAIFDGAGSRPSQGGGAPPQFPNAPPIGTVDNNYRYIGGDPSNPNSWERV